MFYRLGVLACQRRRLFLGVWLAMLVVSLPLAPRLPDALKVGGFSNDNVEAARARAVLEESLDSFTPSVLVVIFESDDMRATDQEFIVQSELALSRILSHPEVVNVTRFIDNPRQISDDGHTAYTLVHLASDSQDAQRLLPEFRELLTDTELETTFAGAPAFFEDIERLSEQDLRRAELIAIPFALIALVFVFGTVVGAAVPLFVGGFSVATVLGLLYFVAQGADLSIFVLNLTTMLGLGLAIDYSLFMTSRFREELRHSDIDTAVAVTVDTAGRAVFFSGFTVLIGLSGLVFFDFMFLRSVGLAGMAVVAFSVLGALTLLPATLSLVGRRIENMSVIRRPDDTRGRFWVRLSWFVMHRPWRVFLPTFAFLVLLGLPFFDANLSSPTAAILPPHTEARQGFETLNEEFGEGASSPIIIALESEEPVTSPENLAALYDYTRLLAADERVDEIESIVTLDPRLNLEQYEILYADPQNITDPFFATAAERLGAGTVTAILVYPTAPSNSDEAESLVTAIRKSSVGPGFEMLVNGGTAEIMDIIDAMYSTFPVVALMVVLATYLVLMFHFRSAILPLKAILMNALSIVASFGALVFIFQQGHFSSLLGFDQLGYIEASQPIIMFCILFGLSMDYEVFLLSRVRESYLASGDNEESVAIGLQRSGRIITGAALIVVLVTGSFVSAEIVLVKSLGLGIAIAVLVDATIVRALLVPATMRLLGSTNWWLPAWLQRILPRWEFAR